MDATAFCSNHVWKRWFWPQKLSINAPRFESAFWNAVYSKSAFWNAVYSKISMDATAFCSNHVWKRWFLPQKLSINAPLIITCGKLFFVSFCVNQTISPIWEMLITRCSESHYSIQFNHAWLLNVLLFRVLFCIQTCMFKYYFYKWHCQVFHMLWTIWSFQCCWCSTFFYISVYKCSGAAFIC